MHKINFHTHRIQTDDQIQILNVFAQDLPITASDQFYSTGLHPWHIGKVNPETCLMAIELAALQKNMLAIGECGLDRAISTDFEIQLKYFKMQMELAEKYGKPIIIHCVRAYSDLLKLKKEAKTNLPWIIHGYQGNLETTRNLIHQDFFFSLGESYLKNEKMHPIIQTIPFNRLFLETDEKDTPIQEIYSMATHILDMEDEILTENISKNFKSIFRNAD